MNKSAPRPHKKEVKDDSGLPVHVSLNKPTSEKALDVDNVLENVVKPFGFWQWMVTVLLAVSSTSIEIFLVFANSVSSHRCKMEDRVELFFREHNLTLNRIAPLIGPWNGQKSDQSEGSFIDSGCYRYRLNWSAIDLEEHFLTENFPVSTNLPYEKCPIGYVHEPNEYQYPDSVIAEFGIVCDKKWLMSMEKTLFMIGFVIGVIISGWLADRIGRKRTLILFSMLELFSGLWTSTAGSYANYVTGRTLMAIGNMGKGNVASILMLEITTAKYRSTFLAVLTSGTDFFFCVLLCLWAYCIPSWRLLSLIAISPHVFTLLYFYFLPESPRWLNSQGRTKAALRVLKFGFKMNRWNDRNEVANVFQAYQPHREPRNRRVKKPAAYREQLMIQCKQCMLGPFGTRKLIKITLPCLVVTTTITTSFFGLLYYARIVRGYVYLIPFFNSLTAIPGILSFLLLYRFVRYRKRPLTLMLATSAFILMATGFCGLGASSPSDAFLTICSNIALILLSTCMSMCCVYMPELYPSEVRAHAFGLIVGIGRVCALLCTFINRLDKYSFHGSPLLVYSCLLYAGVVALFMLKDTNGEKMVDKEQEEGNEQAQPHQIHEITPGI
ncbi:unnamed protein product [Calicophoron daubneyi]|uniref:Major facilitator superfamily (MFS) profile domain-containing protein n=1 Tax=Calicophoron daubneyi TaxID=300641 RepID=A0AAV2TZD4_CALDB